MGFSDRKLALLDSVSVPTAATAPTCGDIIDLGPGTRRTGFDDLYLVVSCTQSFTDNGAGVAPSFVIGVSTTNTTPTGTTATDALTLFGAPSRVFQFGNVDLGAGIAAFGLAAMTAGTQALIGKLTHLQGVATGRYMGCWICVSTLTTDAAGPASRPTAGKLTAYLTSVPPATKNYLPDGF